MPNYFQLFRKASSIETHELVKGDSPTLVTVDEELCAYFEKPVHDQYFIHSWVDTVGFGLAMGRTFDEIIAANMEDMQIHTCSDGERDWPAAQLRVAMFLNNYYLSDAWARIGNYDR